MLNKLKETNELISEAKMSSSRIENILKDLNQIQNNQQLSNLFGEFIKIHFIDKNKINTFRDFITNTLVWLEENGAEDSDVKKIVKALDEASWIIRG